MNFKTASETYSHTLGDYGYKIIKKFNYESLNEFIEIESIKCRLETIKQANTIQYESKKDIIDLFLNNFKSDKLAKRPLDTFDS